MTIWLGVGVALLVALIPCGVLSLTKRRALDRLIGLQMATTIQVLFLMVVAIGTDRSALMDIAIAASFLCFRSNMAYARFVERWL